MTTLYTQGFEGTNGTTMTPANSGMNAVLGTWTFSNAHPRAGTTAAKANPSAATAIINGLDVWTATGLVGFEMFVYVEVMPAATTSILQIRSGTTMVSEVRLFSTGALQIRNQASAQ